MNQYKNKRCCFSCRYFKALPVTDDSPAYGICLQKKTVNRAGRSVSCAFYQTVRENSGAPSASEAGETVLQT